MPWQCPCGPIRCDDCTRMYLGHISGVAAARGDRWAWTVASRQPALLARPWPDTAKARRLAEGKIADLVLSHPAWLRDELVRLVMEAARRRWATITPEEARRWREARR